MIKFTTLVIALVLAPGLNAAVSITTYPLLIDPIVPESRPLPLPVEVPEVELRPLPIFPEVPEIELRPLPIFPEVPEIELRPEALPETKPVPVANPCEACFGYMATLIDQLTETVEPQLPEFLPEAPIEVETLPQPVEPAAPAIPVVLPLPIPSAPVGVRPIVSEAEAEIELAVQNRPLPEYIIR